MPALARKPIALIAGLLMVVAAPAALHIVGTTTATSSAALVGGTVTSAVPNSLFPKVGMNLTVLNNYTAESPLLNRFPLASTWVNWGGAGYGQPVDTTKLNSDGWPVAMPDAGVWEAYVPLDPLVNGQAQNAQYVVRWKGTGDVSVKSVNNIVVSDHQITFTNPYYYALVDINATDPNDPIRDITVVRADQVADFDAGKIFNPALINRVVKNFAAFRTMDWDQINGNQEVNWADRQKPTDALWTRMPIELEVALANQAGVDLWKTVPAHASDDYVRQLTTYIKANLSPSLKLHLEYSNEVWNGSFEQYHWATAQAQTLWQLNDWGASTFYGYRAAQIASIAWSVFGTGSTQLSPVLSGFYGWSGPEVTDAMTKGASLANLGPISQLFREYAVAPYFGDEIGISVGNTADLATILGWAQDTTGNGLTQAFQQLEHGGILQGQGETLDDANSNLEPKHAAWAKANNLALVSYEGGLSFTFFQAPEADKPILLDFYTRLINDPRMGLLYTRMLQNFSANGGKLFVNYNDIGPISEWGPWGMLPGINAPDTPRYGALRAAAAL